MNVVEWKVHQERGVAGSIGGNELGADRSIFLSNSEKVCRLLDHGRVVQQRKGRDEIGR